MICPGLSINSWQSSGGQTPEFAKLHLQAGDRSPRPRGRAGVNSKGSWCRQGGIHGSFSCQSGWRPASATPRPLLILRPSSSRQPGPHRPGPLCGPSFPRVRCLLTGCSCLVPMPRGFGRGRHRGPWTSGEQAWRRGRSSGPTTGPVSQQWTVGSPTHVGSPLPHPSLQLDGSCFCSPLGQTREAY